MSYIAKLTHGARTLDLNAGRYMLDDDFAPPATNLVPTIATGTSANRTSGGRKIGERAIDRAWSFVVHIEGASDAEVARGANDIAAFLALAGDQAEPLYFEFKANTDTPEPLWGNYGSNLKYEIVHASPPQPVRYGVSTLRARSVPHTVALTIKPYAVGIRQRLASATGGIIEDKIGTVDGISRGTIIPINVTNKMTNPVFGHETDLNGWTTGADLASSQITDKRYVLFGLESAKLVNDTAAAADRRFYQSIDVGNTNTHTLSCYAKLPDGSAVSSTQLQLVYSTTIAAGSTTYEAIGDGWYRVYASVTGINAATVTGVLVPHPYTVYVDGVQIEEFSFPTPLAYGDLLGNAWTGTAHASTSTRVQARVRLTLADILDIREGTIRIVWKTPYANTHANDLWFCQNAAGGIFRVYFEATGDILNFSDGTNNASSTAQTFSPGDILVLHATFHPASGLALYKNGSSIGTSATYTPPSAPGTYLYIGTDITPAFNNNGTFMDFATFDVALTSTQVANDYANIAQLVADDQRIGTVPWLWSSDGDDDVVNHDDTDANDDNWIVCGGIPGSAPAVTFISGQTNASNPWLDEPRMYFWLLDLVDFISPTSLYDDEQGTVDATSSGGEYSVTSISTSNVDFTNPIPIAYQEAVRGNDIAFLVRLYDEGSALQIASFMSVPVVGASDFKSLTTTAAFRLYLSPFISIPGIPPGFDDYDKKPPSISVGIRLKRSTGTANVRIDYIALIRKPVLTLVAPVPLSAQDGFYYQGNRSAVYNSGLSGNPYRLILSTQGDIIEFIPERYNILLTLVGDTSFNPVITRVITYTSIIVTPRWSLL